MLETTRRHIEAELERARERFPGNEDRLAALVEEVGEVANALLEHRAGNKKDVDVFMEAIQVACMAIRIAEEGDKSFPYTFMA